MVWSMPEAGKTVKIIINRRLWVGRGVPRPTQSPQSHRLMMICDDDLDGFFRFRHSPHHDVATPDRLQPDFGLCGPVPAEKRFLIRGPEQGYVVFHNPPVKNQEFLTEFTECSEWRKLK